jgi:hypothetical protein
VCDEQCECICLIREQQKGLVDTVDAAGQRLEFKVPQTGKVLKTLSQMRDHMIHCEGMEGPKSDRWKPWKSVWQSQIDAAPESLFAKNCANVRAGSNAYVKHLFMTAMCAGCVTPLGAEPHVHCVGCRRKYHTRCVRAEKGQQFMCDDCRR